MWARAKRVQGDAALVDDAHPTCDALTDDVGRGALVVDLAVVLDDHAHRASIERQRLGHQQHERDTQQDDVDLPQKQHEGFCHERAEHQEQGSRQQQPPPTCRQIGAHL